MHSKKQETCLAILGSIHGVNRAMKRRARLQHGDSVALLMVLSAVAGPGRARPSDLADQLLVDLSSLSRRLTTLENRGLVARIVDEQDRRAQIVELTSAGSELLAALRDSSGASLAETLSSWSLRDLDTLSSLLARLDQDLGAQHADQMTALHTGAMK